MFLFLVLLIVQFILLNQIPMKEYRIRSIPFFFLLAFGCGACCIKNDEEKEEEEGKKMMKSECAKNGFLAARRI